MKRQFPVIVFIVVSFIGQAHAQVIWQKLALPEISISSLQTSPSNKLYLAADKGFYSSTDEGNSWKKFDANGWGIIDSQGVVCQLTTAGLKYSTNEGTDWQIDSGYITNSEYNQMVIATPHYFYALLDGPFVFRTSDYGKHWEKVPFNGNGTDLTWEAVYCSYEGNVFGCWQFDGAVQILGEHSFGNIRTKFCRLFTDNDPISWMSFDFDGFGYAFHNCDLIRSSDDGVHWMPIDTFPFTKIGGPYIPIPHKGIIAVQDTATWLSIDHANTWKKIGDGLPELTQRYFTYFVDRRGAAFLYSDSSLYRMSVFAAVRSSPPPIEDITVHFDPTLNRISLRSENPLGIATASLYAIDGSLLQRTKLDISAPGIFSFDVSDVHTRFAILVLQTEKGVIAKKILF